MLIDFNPVQQGMSAQEVQQKLMTGWIKVGRQTIAQPQKLIVDPSSPMPPGGVIDVDVWMMPEPMVSVEVVARMMVERYEAGDDGIALDNLARALFRVGINVLKKNIESIANQKQEGKKNG